MRFKSTNQLSSLRPNLELQRLFLALLLQNDRVGIHVKSPLGRFADHSQDKVLFGLLNNLSVAFNLLDLYFLERELKIVLYSKS